MKKGNLVFHKEMKQRAIINKMSPSGFLLEIRFKTGLILPCVCWEVDLIK